MSDMDNKSAKRGWRGILTVIAAAAITASLLMNVVLVSRLFMRKATVDEALPAGTRVEPIAVQTMDGQTVRLRFDGAQPTLLYVFSPSCVWCSRNLKSLKAAVEQTGGRYNFVGLSLTAQDLATYVSTTQFPGPVYVVTDAAARDRYHLGSTPETILIGPDGRVHKSWIGWYGGTNKAAVERALQVRLPDAPLPSTMAEVHQPDMPSGTDETRPASSIQGQAACRDDSGLKYSPGAVAKYHGVLSQCGSAGRWAPMSQSAVK